MPAVKEIRRNAYVAWAPCEAYKTVLALGGRGINPQLDLIETNLGDLSRGSYEILASVDMSGNPMGCLSWAVADNMVSAPAGYIAAGFNDGFVKLWNPDEFLKAAVDHKEGGRRQKAPLIPEVAGCSLVATVKYHQPVSCLSFNPIRSSLIACGYDDGMMNIVNIDNPNTPESYEPGTEPIKAHGASTVTDVAWNRTVQHILASACANGSTTIWDLRQRKPSIKFRDPAGRLRVSSVAWLPNQATQVVVAYDDDSNPSFQMRDLRNSSFPFKEFQGHSRGIMDVQFSEFDSMLMLSSGKDNRIVCWALDKSGAAPTIFSETTLPEWHDTVRWSPCLPGLFSASSHIEGIVVDSVQEKRIPTARHVPRWMKKAAGVSFGFGGKLVSFNEVTGTTLNCRVLSSADADLINQADEFEMTLMNGDYLGYCQKRIFESEDEHERLTWHVAQTLFYPPERRSAALLETLGFKVDDVLLSVESFLGHKPGEIFQTNGPSPLLPEGQTSMNPLSSQECVGLAPGGSIEATQAEQEMFNQSVDAESFFNNLGEENGQDGDGEWDAKNTSNGVRNSTDEALSVPAGTHPHPTSRAIGLDGGASRASTIETPDYSSGSDRLIKTAMILGQRRIAVEMCIESNRWSDALLLAATSEDPTLWEKTQNLYLKRQSNDKFLKMIQCIVSRSWSDLVKLADLSRWEETLAVLATYATLEQFPSLASDLGLRLECDRFDIRAAVVCYLAAGDFSHAASVWSTLSVSGHRGKSAQKSLQDLVEKLTVLKKATSYSLDDPLFNEKVSQYAEVLANSGRLLAGMKFLCLVGNSESSARSSIGILRDRIYHAALDTMRQAGLPAPVALPFSCVEVMPAVQQQPQLPAYSSVTQQAQPQQQQQLLAYSNVTQQTQRPRYQQQHQRPYASQQSGLHSTPSYTNVPAPSNPYGIPLPPPATAGPSSAGWARQQHGAPVTTLPPPPSQTRLSHTEPIAAASSLSGFSRSSSGERKEPIGPPSQPVGRPPLSYYGGTAASGMMPQSSVQSNLPPPTHSHSYSAFGSSAPPAASSFPPPQQAANLHAPTYPAAPPIASGSTSMMTNKYPMSPLPPTSQDLVHQLALRPPQLPGGLMAQQHPVNGPPSMIPTASASHTYAPPPPIKSTAPTAGVVNLPQGMPVPWPIPTGTQQVASTTLSTAPANQKIQISATSQGEPLPMAPVDTAFVQRIVFNAHAQFMQHDASGGRESEKLKQTLNDLIKQLQSGSLGKSIQDLVLQYCKALEVGDVAVASQIQGQMVKNGWSKESRVWLPSLKRILCK